MLYIALICCWQLLAARKRASGGTVWSDSGRDKQTSAAGDESQKTSRHCRADTGTGTTENWGVLLFF